MYIEFGHSTPFLNNRKVRRQMSRWAPREKLPMLNTTMTHEDELPWRRALRRPSLDRCASSEAALPRAKHGRSRRTRRPWGRRTPVDFSTAEGFWSNTEADSPLSLSHTHGRVPCAATSSDPLAMFATAFCARGWKIRAARNGPCRRYGLWWTSTTKDR